MPARKPLRQTRQQIKDRFDKAGEYWLEKIPADLGNHAGVVQVPNTENMVYCRIPNGQVLQVFNNIAPNIYNWKVYIGRDKSQPGLLKVIEVRWVWNIASTVAYVLFHHKQHEYPSPDTVWVRRDQFLPLLVLPAGGFTVRIFGDTVYQQGMSYPVKVENQDLDLSSYVPGSGAQYALLEATAAGIINVVIGTNYASLNILRAYPLPSPSAGATPICAIELYDGQTEIRRDDEERNIIDLRQFTSDVPTDIGNTINDAPAGLPLLTDYIPYWDSVNEVLRKASIAFINYAMTNILHYDVVDEFGPNLSAKTYLHPSDRFIIEDSENGLVKKYASRLSVYPGGMATFAKEGVLTTQTGTMRIYNCFGRNVVIDNVFLGVNTAPTGADLLVDVNISVSGITPASIFFNSANRAKIVAGAYTGGSSIFTTNPNPLYWNTNEFLQFDIDQIGSTVAGSDLTVQILFH